MNPLRERVLSDDGHFVNNDETPKSNLSNTALQARIHLLEKRVSDLSSKEDKQKQKELEEVKGKFSSLHAENRLLKEKLSLFESTNPKLEKQVEELSAQNRLLKSEVRGFEQELKRNEGKENSALLAKIQGEMAQLEKEYKEVCEELKKLKK